MFDLPNYDAWLTRPDEEAQAQQDAYERFCDGRGLDVGSDEADEAWARRNDELDEHAEAYEAWALRTDDPF